MTLQTLDDALTLTADADGVLHAALTGDFSNGQISAPPEKGFPFGGLLAALSAKAMRQGLGLTAPLRSLSVQYLAAAAYDVPVRFEPRLLRGGRTIAYTALEVRQGDRLTHHAQATWGDDDDGGVSIPALTAPPPPIAGLDPRRTLSGPLAPRFSQHVDYQFETGPTLLQGKPGPEAIERLWMRTKDRAPLDELRLCYLMDALYPPAWVAASSPLRMATVDLRYDILADPTPETAPDGWAFFEFRMLDLGKGWTVDDLTVWGADGTPLAVGRQRRKASPTRAAGQG